MKSVKLISLILVVSALKASARHEEQVYVPDPNPLIQKRIDQWQDIKFGLLMHWGPYSQWGIVESWSICPDYWWPQFPPFDRNVNYDPAVYPERWNSFVNYTHNQVMKLCTNYGKMDLFWFDGGWVRKNEIKVETPHIPGFKVKKVYNQDIRMDELVDKIRSKQPEAIVVDRAVEGKNQNYLTPENRVPDKMLPYPWESCIILGGGWSYSFNAKMMPTRSVIHMLSDIVAKGGNLLLNIGPGPDGTWYDEAYNRLNEIGNWLRINGEAIYSTRTIAPYFDGKLRYNRGKDGSAYIIYLLGENEKLPAEIQVNGIKPAKGAKISMLGQNLRSLKWKSEENSYKIQVPENQIKTIPSQYAVAFKISQISD